MDGDGKLTLREALEAAGTDQAFGDAIAGSATEVDEIRFSPEAFAGGLDTLSLVASLEAKGDGGPLKITGPGRDQLSIDGSLLASPIFKVFGEVTISDLTLTKARQSAVTNGTARDISTGSEVDVSSDIVLEDVYFRNNRGVNGGAVDLSKGSLIVRDSRFEGNSASGKGGAIFVERSVFSDVDVLIKDVQFVNNSASGRGGAIANENTRLTILRSEFENNTSLSDGGAIASNTVEGFSSTRLFESALDANSSNARGGALFATGSGEVIIGESTLAGNAAVSLGGGAAFVGDVAVTIRATWLSENSAVRGGGIYSKSDTIDVDSSTFSTNSSSQDGGGLAVVGNFTMVNSTLSQNSAGGFGGGLWWNDVNPDMVLSEYSLIHNTIVRNRANADGVAPGDGGGLAINAAGADSRTRFRSNLVAGNVTGEESNQSASDIHLLKGLAVTGISSNLIGDPHSAGGMVGDLIGDEFGNEISLDTIIFRELSDNLGGMVPVHALKLGSPAIDAVTVGTDSITSDARGYPFLRQDEQIGMRHPADMGAFEVQFRPLTATTEIVVSTTRDESDGDYSYGDLSLREAVELANRRTDRNAIRFDRALLPTNGIATTITLNGNLGPLSVMWDFSLTGPGANLLNISGNDQTGIFEIGSLATVDFSGIRFIQGRADEGGAIVNRGITSLIDTEFALNQSVGTLMNFTPVGGGAIVNDVGGILTIRDSVLESNSAEFSGGAIFNRGSITIGPNVDLFRNTASNGAGGGLYNFRGDATILDSWIASNTATSGGGVGSGLNGSVDIRRSKISGNAATSGGGGGLEVRSSLAMYDTNVYSNRATPPRFFQDQGVTSEAAGAAGGGLFVRPNGGSVVIDRSTFQLNTADANGVLVTNVTLEDPPIITTAENHLLNTGDKVSLQDFTTIASNGTPSINASRSATVTKLSDRTLRLEGVTFSRLSDVRLTGFGGAPTRIVNAEFGGLGGGIAIAPSSSSSDDNERIVVRSSTISNNTASGLSADGGGILILESVRVERVPRRNDPIIESSTIAGNYSSSNAGSQLSVRGPLARLSNTIIDDFYETPPMNPVPPDAYALFFRFDSSVDYSRVEHNLVSSIAHENGLATAVATFSSSNDQGNIIGPSRLEQLPRYNGGFTPTQAFLGTDSLALESGKRDGLLDQRGFPVTDSDFTTVGDPRVSPNGYNIVDGIADIGAYESSEVFIQRFNYGSPNLSQFGTGEALVVGEGFSDGNNSRVREEPGFFGLEFDPDPFTVGPGVGEVLGTKAGGQARVDLDGRVGFEYGYYVNSGSVTTNYDGLFSYTTETDPQDSQKFIIKTGLTLQDGSLFTVSPRVGAFLDMVFELNAEITGEACLGSCVDGTFKINVDEKTPIFSINRQEVLRNANDEPILDAQGNPQFLYLNSNGAETTTKAGNAPKLDGNVFIGESPIDDLADSVLDSAEQQALDQAIEASGGYLAYLNLQRDTQRNARIDLATKTVNDFLNEVDEEDAAEALKAANDLYEAFVDLKKKALQDAIKEEKKLTMKGDQPKKGVGTYITVSAGQAEGDLLGLEFELSLGARRGELAGEKPLGKLAVTVPEIELEDRKFDNDQGRLSASTSAFANGSEQDARRQLAALSIDVGAIGPLGVYRTNLGPLDIEVTTVSYKPTPRIKLSQDVVVEPFFDADHAAIFELTFPDCQSICTATVAGDVIEGAGTISSNDSAEARRIKFVPGSKIEIDTHGHKIEVAPYLNIGQRFTNDLGIDFDIVGVLEILALKLSAFGKDIIDVGPLIEQTHTLLDDIDLGSIFNATFDLDTTDQALNRFTLDSNPNQSGNEGISPGDAVVLSSRPPHDNIPSLEDYQPAAFDNESQITPTRYFSVSLLDPNGVPQRDVRFETSGNHIAFIRPPYEGLQLEILDGDLVTSRFDLPIQGFTFKPNETPKAFKLIGFENLLGSRAIFGLGFNTESSFDITASAEGGSGLTTVGENTDALNTEAMRDAGLLTLIENDFAFDIDGDGVISVTTDGELVIRYMEGKTGSTLIQGALSQNAAARGATRADAVSIFNYLQDLETSGRLDVDQNALVEKQFDGVLILRHLSGIGSSIESSPALTDKPGGGALLGEGAMRTDPQAIADFIDVGNRTPVRANPSFAKDTLSRTSRETPSEIESSIDATAVIGSSPYVPFLATYVNGVASYGLDAFGIDVEFLNTYLQREDDPSVRDLIQSRAQGAPGRTRDLPESVSASLANVASLSDATSRADLVDELGRRLTTETDTKAIGVDEPLFIRLPASGGYEFSLPDAGTHQITRLVFDPAVDGNAFLNHVDPSDDRDFTLFIPATNMTFPVSIETPFDLPSGTKTFRLFPRGVDENAELAKLFEPENANPPVLDLNVGLLLSGDTSTMPTLTVKALQNEQADIDPQAQLDVPNSVDLPTQMISIEAPDEVIDVGETFSVDIFYELESAQPTPPPAILFEIHFDSQRINFQGITLENLDAQLVVPGLVNSTTAATPENTEVVPDGDLRTDLTLVLSYNASLGDWQPGSTNRRKIATIDFLAVAKGVSKLRVTGLSSADYDFGGTTEQSVLLSDSPAGFTVSRNAVTVSESGSTETFTVVLNTIPASDVVLNISSDDLSEATVQPTRLTFNRSNWSFPQTVSVSGVDDLIADGDQFGTITVGIDDALSNDAFDNVADQSIAVTTTDNESTAAVVTLSKTTASVTEAGATDSFDVRLLSAPSSNVVLKLTSAKETEVTVAPATLTFTPSNWNVPQSVVLSGVDDLLRDGDQVTSVTVSVDDSLSDDAFDASADVSLSVTTIDDGMVSDLVVNTLLDDDGPLVSLRDAIESANQTAGHQLISFSPSIFETPASIVLTQGSLTITDSVTIAGPGAERLAINGNTQPGIFFISDDDLSSMIHVTISGLMLTGTAESLGGAAIYSLENLILRDSVISDNAMTGVTNVFGTLLVDSSTISNNFGGIYNEQGTMTIQSSSISGNVGGGGGVVNWGDASILDTQVTGNVMVGDGGGVFNGFGATLTIRRSSVSDNMAASSQPGSAVGGGGGISNSGTLTVFDSIVSQNTASFLGGGIQNYGGMAVVRSTISNNTARAGGGVEIGTNGAAAIINSTISGNTATGEADGEGGGVLIYSFDTFRPVLFANSTISGNVAKVAGSGILSYTSTIISHNSIIAGNRLEDGQADDIAGGLPLDGSSSYNLVGVDSTPGGLTSGTMNNLVGVDWTGILENDGTHPVLKDNGGITKTIALLPNSIAIDAGKDALALDEAMNPLTTDQRGEARIVGAAVDVGAFEFIAGPAPAVIVVDPASTVINESGTSVELSIVLNTPPVGSVVVNITSSDPTEARPRFSNVAFGPNDWNVPRIVPIDGVQDVVVDGDQHSIITISVDDSLSDDAFDTVDDHTLTVTTTDDDVAGFSISKTTATVSESGTTASFTVVLNASPLADVVIDVSSGDTSEAVVSPASLTFTPSDWDRPRTMTITGVNDSTVDGNQTTIIRLSINDNASDNAFDSLVDQAVTVTTTDDDAIGFSISKTTVTVSESGTAASFTVVLGARPQSNVVIDITSNDTGEAAVLSTPLTFTPSDWDTPQAVAITGVNDSTVDGPQTTMVSLSINDDASDNAFDSLADQTVTVTTTDDDVPGFSLSKTAASVSETGSTDTFTVVLAAQPLSNVVVNVTSDDSGEATVNVGALTFTPATWNNAQTVTITGVNDPTVDGPQTSTIRLSINDDASDNAFDSLADQTVTVTTTDDDVPGFSLSKTAASVSETGSTDTFTVVLAAQPLSNVVVNVTSDDTGEATVNVGGLTFTPATWNNAQTVTITGVNDPTVDGPQTSTIRLSINDDASDNAFDSLADQIVTVTTTDDDSLPATPTVTLRANPGNIAEAAGVATFTATLSATTDKSVTIQLGFSGTATLTDDYTRSDTQIVIPAGQTTGSITVTAVQDTLVEGSETVVVDITNVTNGTESGTQRATASITDSHDAIVSFTLSVSDLFGNPLPNNQVEVGQNFRLNAFVQDVRPNPTGVFAGYLDVAYDSPQRFSVISSEQQRLKLSRDATGGTYELTFQGVSTGPIPLGATSSAAETNLQLALENHSAIGAGNVRVAKTAVLEPNDTETEIFTNQYVFDISFVNELAEINLPELEVDASLLTGTSGPPIGSVATIVDADPTRSDPDWFRNAFMRGPLHNVGRRTSEDGDKDPVTGQILDPNVFSEVGFFIGLYPFFSSGSEGDVMLLWSVDLRADNAGSIHFTGNPADVSPDHDLVVVDLFTAVPVDKAIYGSVSIEIVEAGVGPIQLPAGETQVTNENGTLFVRNNGNILSQIARENVTELNFLGGPGDEILAVGDLGLHDGNAILLTFDGGDGTDTLRSVEASQTLDLTKFANGSLQNVEIIDIEGSDQGVLVLTLDSVLAVSAANQRLRLQHDASDTIKYGGGWSTEIPEVIEGRFLHILKQENATIEVANSLPFRNPLLPLDTNRDGFVAPLDALIIINRLNVTGPQTLVTPETVIGLTEFFYLDTNGDHSVAPIDVLIIVNWLNDPRRNSEGELQLNSVTLTSLGGANLSTRTQDDMRHEQDQSVGELAGKPVFEPRLGWLQEQSIASAARNMQVIGNGVDEEDLNAAIEAFFAEYDTKPPERI